MLKRKELLLVGGLFLFGILSYLVILFLQEEGSYIEIQTSGTVLGRFDLSEEQTIDLNSNIIRISDGKVYMEYANCPDKLCIKQGSIQKTGEMIVCLPNQIVIEVKSEKNKSDIDGYVR